MAPALACIERVYSEHNWLSGRDLVPQEGGSFNAHVDGTIGLLLPFPRVAVIGMRERCKCV